MLSPPSPPPPEAARLIRDGGERLAGSITAAPQVIKAASVYTKSREMKTTPPECKEAEMAVIISIHNFFLLLLRFFRFFSHTRIHTQVHTHKRTHTRAHTHTSTHTCTNTQTNTHTHTNTQVHTNKHVHPHKYTHTNKHAHTHIQVHTHTQVHTHKHTPAHEHAHRTQVESKKKKGSCSCSLCSWLPARQGDTSACRAAEDKRRAGGKPSRTLESTDRGVE